MNQGSPEASAGDAPVAESGADAEPEAAPVESGADVANASPPADTGADVDDAAPDDAPGLEDGPFPTCSGGNPPGDGGSWCALYDVATDGAIQDEAGRPTGISVQEACTAGQPCTACLGGAMFAGWCE